MFVAQGEQLKFLMSVFLKHWKVLTGVFASLGMLADLKNMWKIFSPGENEFVIQYQVSQGRVNTFGGLWNKKYVADIQN